MNDKPETRQLFEEAIERPLKAMPEVVSPIIKTIADELTCGKNEYKLSLTTSSEDIKANLERFTIQVQTPERDSYRDSYGNPYPPAPIGIITLQPLPGNLTLFRVPPRSRWSKSQKYDFDTDGALFTYFIQYCFIEFQRLGLICFKEEKPPIGFRPSHKEKDD